MGEKGSSFGDYWKFYDKCKDIEAEVWSKNEFMNLKSISDFIHKSVDVRSKLQCWRKK